MHSDYKIFGLNNRLVWGLILSLQILAGGLAFASIFIKSWVVLDYLSYGLFTCTGCDWTQNYFTKYSDFDCDGYNDYSCKFLDGMRKGILAYMICVSPAIIFTLFWIINSLSCLNGKNTWGRGVIMGFLATVSAVVGIIAYSIVTNTSFTNCEDSSYYIDNRQPGLCSSDGLNTALASSIIYFVTLVAYSFTVHRQKAENMEMQSYGLS